MKLTITFFYFLITSICQAQSFNSTQLDDYFNALETSNKFMGSIAISKNGELLYTRSVGFADAEKKLKANSNSKYRIGSITKTFTSVLVLKAVEEQKLSLQQSIASFFPAIPNAEKITVEQLLTHRSGIHSFTDNEDYIQWNTLPKTEKELVALIAEGGSDFAPGSKAAYSNSNFVLLTFILEKSFKKGYAALVTEYITKPLKLKNTSAGGKINTEKNECKSYQWTGIWKKDSETDSSIPLGAGNISSTPSDLVRFSDGLFNGKLLSEKSLLLMKTIHDSYGMGLFKMPFYEKSSYGHTGGIDSFSSVFGYFENENVSFAITSNGSTIAINDIAIAVLSSIFDKPFDVPSFKTYKVSSEELEAYPGVYASSEIPMKITIVKEGSLLTAQATGQSSFPLEATEKDTFTFDQAGIILKFNVQEKSLTLKQNGMTLTFIRE